MNDISLSSSDREDNAKAKGFHEIVYTCIQISALLAACRLDLIYISLLLNAQAHARNFLYKCLGDMFYDTRS
jgi:hypothetical protein